MPSMAGEGTRQATRRHHSAGGVVLSVRSGELSVPLVATRKRTRWGLPKGTVDEGEQSEQTALREVLEETGLKAEVVMHLGAIDYFFRAKGVLIHKFVDFYLMRHLEGSLRPQLTEVDDAVWFTLDEAIKRESYDSERDILEKARTFWSGLSEEERLHYSVDQPLRH